MRVAVATCAAVAAAALLGLTPLRSFAADPSPATATPLGPVIGSPVERPRGSTGQDASARQDESVRQDASARENASARQEASARENASGGQDASVRREHAASDRPHRGARQRRQAVPAGPLLDLAAPPINHVMTPEQVHALVSGSADEGPEDVMVEENRYQEPVPRGQIRALAWALLHPLEAWRIFTPVTD